MSELSEAVAEALHRIRDKRPPVGLRAGFRYVADTVQAVISGVMVTVLLAVAGALFTGDFVGGSVGAIIGLLFSAKMLARPNRDWRSRLIDRGFVVEQLELEGPATQVEIMRTESARLAYLLNPAGDHAESLVVDVGLPDCLQFDGREWRLLVEPAERPRLRACITWPVHQKCRLMRPVLRIVDGQARLRIPDADLAELDALIESLTQLAMRLRDPLTALYDVAGGISEFDAARAAAVLIHEGRRYPENPLTDWVSVMLSGRVTDAMQMSRRNEVDEEDAVRALSESGVPTDAWYAPLVYFARRLPADEPGALRALGLLNAAGATNGMARLQWLETHGTVAALQRLKAMRWSDALQFAGEKTVAVLLNRLDLHGALAVDTQADGGLAFAETGQLSAPED